MQQPAYKCPQIAICSKCWRICSDLCSLPAEQGKCRLPTGESAAIVMHSLSSTSPNMQSLSTEAASQLPLDKSFDWSLKLLQLDTADFDFVQQETPLSLWQRLLCHYGRAPRSVAKQDHISLYALWCLLSDGHSKRSISSCAEAAEPVPVCDFLIQWGVLTKS